jgi:hypothetical protein
MAKAKKVAAKKSKKVVVKVASFDVNPKILAAAKAEMKKEDQTLCGAIRTVAKRFSKERRGVIEATLVKGLKVNLGTARRQIQLGRSA